MHRAGLRYFDTAPFYGLGLAEHRLGACLRRVDRREIVLSTKVGRLLQPVGEASRPEPSSGHYPFEVAFDYSYDGDAALARAQPAAARHQRASTSC